MAVYEQLQRQGIAYTLGFPNVNSYLGFVKKLGFADLGRPKILVKILDPVAFVGGKKVADKWPRFAARVRTVTKVLRGRPNSAVYTRELSGFERLRIEDLWEPVDVVVAADKRRKMADLEIHGESDCRLQDSRGRQCKRPEWPNGI